jgi:hypothetical protein
MVDSRRVTTARARPLASRSGRTLQYRRTADGEQDHGAGATPAGELAQVQRIGVAGQPAVPGQEPGEASRSGSVKAGWMVTRAVDRAVVVIGHLPAGLRPGRLGQRVPAIERKPNVSFSSRSLHVTDRRNLERGQPPGKALPADSETRRLSHGTVTYIAHINHSDVEHIPELGRHNWPADQRLSVSASERQRFYRPLA